MSRKSETSPGPFQRVWRALLDWQQAMDYSPYDYALDRVGTLEREVRELKDQVTSLQRDRAPVPIRAAAATHSRIQA